eukprot:1595908-Rhodomonas_salina.1
MGEKVSFMRAMLTHKAAMGSRDRFNSVGSYARVAEPNPGPGTAEAMLLRARYALSGTAYALAMGCPVLARDVRHWDAMPGTEGYGSGATRHVQRGGGGD